MMKQYILAIDRGQTSIKAAITDLNGKIHQVASTHCEPIQTPHPGFAQQDMDLIWQQAAFVIRKVLTESDVDAEEISAVSFSGQGGGNFLIDQEGVPTYPGVLSMDSRHEALLKKLRKPEKVTIPRTAAFMRWLKDENPAVYERTRWVFGSKDWIRYCLTDAANVDMSDTPLPVDPVTGKYDTRAFDVLGIPECAEKLPDPVYASRICGHVTGKAAKKTGLMEGTPVACGAHDMIACSVGAGGRGEGHLAIIMGTMGINIAVVDRNTILKPVSRPGESFEFCGAVPGQRMATTSIGSGCNTMNWFLQLLFREEMQEARAEHISVFTLLERKLNYQQPVDLIFQPYLLGTIYNSNAKAGIFGISQSTTREDLIQALFQGIALSMCMEIEKLEARIRPFDDIWIVGGGAKSSIWGQMFADILGKKVRTSRSPEVGCRGAAICAGIALGAYTMDTAPQPVVGHEYTSRRKWHELYQQQLEVYRKAYIAEEPIWDELHTIS